MECYFDNAATTAVFPEVKELMMTLLDVDYGNPSSQHKKGLTAKDYERTATEQVAKTLKCMPKEIVFTSGGTEANNLALIGAALAHRRAGKHIITTPIEHASVLSTVEFLQKEGFEISFMEVGSDGKVDLDSLSKLLRDDTILVSCMYVNNEIGSIQPIEALVKLVKAHNPQTLVHVDAVQAYGKLKFTPKQLGVDLLSVSGHKIHGPKGSGALYIKDKTLIRPIIYGGGQQNFMRSGTENLPGIAGMGLAAEMIYTDHETRMQHVREVRDYLVSEVTKIEGVYDHSGEAPHIASISFEGVRAAVLMRAIGDKGIYVSAGSACSSNKPQVSHVLTAIGLSQEQLESTLRFSFCEWNTKEEVDYCVEVLKETLPMLRRYTRKK